MNEQREPRKKLGALWIKEISGGRKIMTGILEVNGDKIKVVAFRNTEKRTDKSPDFTIYEDTYKKPDTPPASDNGPDGFLDGGGRTPSAEIPF